MHFPLHRFEEFGALSTSEQNALKALGELPRHHPRHGIIQLEADKPKGFFLLVDGWVAAAQTLRDGQRQILKIHLPGDALGTPSMCMTHTVEELRAITEAVTIHVPFDRFGRLFDEHPRLAAHFLLNVQAERVALMDRIVSIGRTSAKSRIAAFLLDLADRLTPLGLVQSNSFFMVLTQSQIADALGLTEVHINRSLREIEAERLIARFGQRYTLVDPEALKRLAGQPIRNRMVDQSWIPAQR